MLPLACPASFYALLHGKDRIPGPSQRPTSRISMLQIEPFFIWLIIEALSSIPGHVLDGQLRADRVEDVV